MNSKESMKPKDKKPTENPEEKKDSFQKRHERFLKLVALNLSGNTEEYEKLIESLTPEEAARTLEVFAHALYEEQKWQEAISAYQKYFKTTTPQTPFPYYELADSYMMMRDFQNAEKYIQQGKLEFPDYEKFDLLLAAILGSTGQLYAATQILGKLLLKDPFNQDLIRSYFGSLAQYEYYVMGNLQKAKSHLQEIFEKIDDEEMKKFYRLQLELFELDYALKEAIKNETTFEVLKSKLSTLKEKINSIKERASNTRLPCEYHQLTIQALLDSMEGKPFDKIRIARLKNSLEQQGIVDEAKLLDSLLKFSDYIKDLMQQHKKEIPKEEQKKALLILKTKTETGLTNLANQPREQKEKPKKAQEEVYEIFLSVPSGIGTQEISTTEQEHKKYRNHQDKYDIFIYHRDVYTKKNDKPLKLENISYGILVLLLRYKDKPLPPIPLARKLNVKVNEVSPEGEKDAHKGVKPFLTPIRNAMFHIKEFNIEKIRNQPIKCNGKFSFCVILSKHEAKNYYLSEGAFAEREEGFR